MSILPDWNSIESTARWSDFLFWAGIVCLVLLAATEVASHIYGTRSTHLSSDATRTERNHAEEEAKKQRAADQTRFNADAEQMRKQLTEAENVAAEAGKKISEFERLRMPRHLSEAQKRGLATFLIGKPKGHLTIQASVNAPDARNYAEEIAAVFNAAGWNVPVSNTMFIGGDTSGIWITVRDAAIPEVANTVHAALRASTIPIRDGALGDINGPATDEAWLKIGSIK